MRDAGAISDNFRPSSPLLQAFQRFTHQFSPLSPAWAHELVPRSTLKQFTGTVLSHREIGNVRKRNMTVNRRVEKGERRDILRVIDIAKAQGEGVTV